MSSREKIIGGKFGYPIKFSDKRTLPQFLAGNPVLFFNARSGIKLVVDQLKPRKIWLPSYLCPTIITAIDSGESEIAFYSLNSNLKISSTNFITSIYPDDLFLFIDYFGFSFDKKIVEQVRTRGCQIIRDCSQALFFDHQNDDMCDYHLYSPRKFLGVPDGGILHFKTGTNFVTPILERPDDEVMYLLNQALILRREFDLYGGNRIWNDYFKRGESRFTPGRSSMSELTRIMLEFAFDFDQIKTQRRRNYSVLSSKLGDLALFPVLSPEVTPLGFPVRVQNREVVQKGLFAKSIYPPIHWSISNSVPEQFLESHQLAQQIMTIPCDQRYDEEDMDFVSDSLLELIR